MFPAISSPECHVHFSKIVCFTEKKRTLQGWFSRKVAALTTLGCFISSTKVRLQPGCMLGLGTLRWRRRMDGWGEPWKLGGNTMRIWMDSFLVFAIKFSVLQRCSLMVGRLFFVYFFHSWDNCFWTLSNWIPPILTTDEVLLAKMNPGFKNSCF